MEEHLYTLLSNAVSFPVAWRTLGSGTSTPRAVMGSVGGSTDYALAQRGPTKARLQLDVFGATYAEAKIASRQVEAVLDGYQGGPVQGVFVLVPAQDRTADDSGLLFHMMTIYEVTYV